MKDNHESQRVGLRILRITAVTAAIYAFFQLLPDFAPDRPDRFLRRVTGDVSPELCDFSSLGFKQVSESKSPLVMRLMPQSEPRTGEEVRVTIALNRIGGKPVTLDDLQEVHTEQFHLLIVDASLEDYHHEHPEPTVVPGEFTVSFTPRKGGTYRFFADLLPVVTQRPAHAVADLAVAGEEEMPDRSVFFESASEDYRFVAMPPKGGFQAKKPALVSLQISHSEAGRPVTLDPIMGAYAHLVAFDRDRSGFAHMHPVQEGLDLTFDETAPELDFMFYAEEPGLYAVWAQVKIDGQELFAPFVVEVL